MWSSSETLRLLVYEGNPNAREMLLRSSWSLGARLFRAVHRIDASYAARSWRDALAWLTSYRGDEPIAEIQVWSHGKWGCSLFGDERLTERAFDRGSSLRDGLGALRSRMLGAAGSLVWFRTCETFGADAGHRFAERVAGELGARVAGHTYAIDVLQSGLHGLEPGDSPRWPTSEGLARGTPTSPEQALASSLTAPNTIHFLQREVPAAWFQSVQ